MIGKTLSHYEITAKLGAGGMGEVYRAADTKLGREVALKVLPAEMASSPERLERFQREAKALAALDHPGIVGVYSVEEAEGVHFLTMQLVDGQPLAELIPEGGLPVEQTLGIALALTEALAAAHEKGIIHRDLKPANVMVSEDGHLKILDFGLARMTAETGEVPGSSQLPTEMMTRQGVVMGTAPYMSPEQIEGRSVDVRTDVFSLGIVLYEMVTGRRPFQGRSSAELASAILHQSPPPPDELRTDLPEGWAQAIGRCLEKKRGDRFASAREIHEALAGLADDLRPSAPATAGTPPGALGRPLVRAGLALASLALLAALGWLAWRANRTGWARKQVLPEAAQLAEAGRYSEAAVLAERAERYLPGDPVLAELWSEIAVGLDVESEPSGATVEIRPYGDEQGEARQLGQTPLRALRLPKGTYRWRFSEPDSEPIERAAAAATGTLRVTLPPAGIVPAGMVLVPEGADVLFVAAYGLPRGVSLADYFIQRYEVTNREYKEFVDAGAYRRPELWNHPFVDGGRTLAWEEAMERFRDQAGQLGPATWEVGAYPAGQDDFPVGGVSWYEAAAYCEFKGLDLPTLNHWFRAADPRAGPYLLPAANFDYRGPQSVGASHAMSPFGSYDMAGNVKEWARNASSDGLRYSVGGGWGEPEYMFGNIEPRNAFDRSPKDGIRCAQYPEGQPDARSAAPFDRAARNFRVVPPVSDEMFESFVRMQRYAPMPLEARVEQELDSDPETRVERVSFSAAYSGDRVVAYLWLPKGVEPPYQTLVIYPGSEGLSPTSSAVLEQPDRYDFLVRSGRAVVHPVYYGMYERWAGNFPATAIQLRDFEHKWSQDVQRTLDYLEARPEFDLERVAYFGSSLGAWFAPIPLAVEPRLRLAILVGGGLAAADFEPEFDTLNYIPRVKQPLLLLCGRYDYFFPYEASQKPFIERIGTPEEDKRHVVVDSGHSVPRADYLKEVLGWLDKYFGPAR